MYGLIDPRDNEYFYIGKGKGNRYKHHFNRSNQLDDTNHNKVNKIREIEGLGHSVIVDFIFTEIDEDDAFELEKVLIYKLGREMFDEGKLTNLNIGGIGNFYDLEPYHYKKWYTGFYDISKLSKANEERFNLIKKKSINIKYVSYYYIAKEYKFKEYVFLYDNLGSYRKKEPLKISFNINFTDQIDLEKYIYLKESEYPIFFDNYILSKKKLDEVYVSIHIPLSDYDIIDEEFHLKFDKLYPKEKYFEIECKINNIVRMRVNRNNDTLTVNSFYSSGNKKSLRKTLNKKPMDTDLFWYENGNLKSEKIYYKNDLAYVEKEYYKNGTRKDYRNPKTRVSKSWYENGKLKSIFKMNTGFIRYDENGKKVTE